MSSVKWEATQGRAATLMQQSDRFPGAVSALTSQCRAVQALTLSRDAAADAAAGSMIGFVQHERHIPTPGAMVQPGNTAGGRIAQHGLKGIRKMYCQDMIATVHRGNGHGATARNECDDSQEQQSRSGSIHVRWQSFGMSEPRGG